MPILKKSVSVKKVVPEFLRDDEEVFFCELTKEVFRNYDDYFEKIMLLSSMVWTCEYTRKQNLTYSEALESEKKVKDALKKFPKALKIAMILIIQQTKCATIVDLCDEVFNYMKDRYFKNETVEVDVGKKEGKKEYAPVKIIDIINTNASSNEDEAINLCDLKFKVKSKDKSEDPWLVNIEKIRRPKALCFVKDKIKIVLKQFIEQSKGVLIVKQTIYKKYITDDIDYSKVFIGKLTNKELTKGPQPKPAANVNNNVKKKLVKQSTISQYMTSDTKKKLTDEEIIKRKEDNALKRAEQQRKLIELREAQKAELLLKFKATLKNFNQIIDDLELPDQKPLPVPKPINGLIGSKHYGDFLYVFEFMHSFCDLLSIHDKYPGGISIEILERAFLLREPYGPLNDIIQVLLSTLFSLQLEETNEVDIYYADVNVDEKKLTNRYDIAICNASRVAKYAVKYYSANLEELPMDATTISELLRLHLLSSGAKINEKGARWRFQQRGGYQSADDPGLYLRIKQPHILKQLSYCTVFELSLADIFKVIICLIDQILTYSSVRDVVEERIEKSVKARFNIRMMVASEKRRELKVNEDKKEVGEGIKKKLESYAGEETDKEKYNEKLEKESAVKIATIEASSSRDKKKYLNQLKEKREEYFAHQINLGSDRAHRNYWLFESLPGLFVEHNENYAGQCLNGITKYIPGLAQCDESQRKSFIKQMVMNYQSNNNIIKNNIMEIDKENKINNIIDDKTNTINNAVTKKDDIGSLQKELFMCTSNHFTCPVHSVNNAERIKWSYFHTEEDINNLINSLNSRGIREKQLKEKLISEKDLIIEYIKDCPVEKFSIDNYDEKLTELIKSTKRYDKMNGSFSLFSKPDIVMQIQVREAILDLEERIKSGYLGNLIVNDRDKWRENLTNDLYKMDCDELKWGSNKEFSKDDERVLNDTVAGIDLGNTTTLDLDDSDDEILVLPTQSQTDIIYSYACALLQIEQGIEAKYYKKPFGVTKLTKDPTVNEQMLERARESLDNWEISLMMSTNYSQLFLHLNILSDSIQWSQSATYAKCQICRRKNNPDLMLLCDGCNRGHHMYCLKPKLNKVPTGDWFCQNCKPIEKKEKPKRTRKIFKDDSDDEEEEYDENKDEDDNSVTSVVEEQEEEVEEEVEIIEEDDEDEEMESLEVEEEEIDFDDDSNICGICNFEGQLASCSECSFLCHIECADPPLKRLPRANHWQCMKCRKKTSKKRSRESLKDYVSDEEDDDENEDDSDDDDGPKRKSRRIQFPVNSIPIKFPNSRRSRRNDGDDVSFNNAMLSKLLDDIIKNTNAWPFNRPVHKNEVPDYYEIIKCPMDFATIKSKLNLGDYKSNADMIEDIQLIFTNCDLYNDNHSEVYQAGIRLEKFVEGKCKELNLPFKRSDGNTTNKKRRTN